VPHWQFYRLTEPLQFLPEPADILVGDLADPFKPADRFIREDDLCLLGDDHRFPWLDLDHLVGDHLRLDEGQPDRNRYRVPQGDWEVNQGVMNGPRICRRDILGEILRRSKDHEEGRNDLIDPFNPDGVTDRDTRIDPGEVVDPDLILVPVGQLGPPDLRDRGRLPEYMDNISRGESELVHRLGIQPGFSPSLITGICTIDLEECLNHYLTIIYPGIYKYSKS